MTLTAIDEGLMGRVHDVVAVIRSAHQELREIAAEIVDTGSADACGYTTKRRLLDDLLHDDPATAGTPSDSPRPGYDASRNA